MWLENNKVSKDTKKGETWNLIPKDLWNEIYASIIEDAGHFAGFKTKIDTSQIKNDWEITQQTAEQVPLKGKMYFRDTEHIRLFSEFVGDFSRTLKLYYDPVGNILPESQLHTTWYKECIISVLDKGNLDHKVGMFVVDITITMLSAMWRRDNTIASSVVGVLGEPHQYNYYYPYYFRRGQNLVLELLNNSERTGCEVRIINKSGKPLDRCAWQVNSDNNITQYAKWLAGTVKLEDARTIVIDSNPRTMRSQIEFEANRPIDIVNYQEPNPQYINFVDVYPGRNEFIFDLGIVSSVDVTVSYTEQARVV